MTARHKVLLRNILVGWATLLFPAAIALVIAKIYISGITMFVEAGASSIYALYFYLENNDRIKKYHVFLLSLFLLFTTCSSAVFFRFLTNPPVPPFYARVKSMMTEVAPDHRFPSTFDIINVQSDKVFIAPVDILANISIGNASNSPQTIIDISLSGSMNAKGPWTEFCAIPTTGSGIALFGSNIKKVPVGSTTNFAEDTILNKTMAPTQVISGWTAWNLPSNFVAGIFRLKITDSSGKKIIVPLNTSSPDKAALLDGNELLMKGFVDLGNLEEVLIQPCTGQ